ncbi:MAG: GAF domain-containing protein, partial [Chloroflexi bacterium]|nr:GAF domain-containing protein [Chloroflexota bacterium]
VVEPLYFRDNQLGLVLFEADPWQGTTYHVLRGQISSALKGTLLLEEVGERAYQIQAAAEVAQIVSSFLDLDVLMDRVVSLVRERFDLYYVGLFLVDESGEWTDEPDRWVVLRSGTGEAGEAMMAEGHKLEVGGSSMIGQCVANQEARIALDVGQAAVRFDNPHLPDTHSEMALPLISRGEAIGALTIQSAERAAFSEEDIAVLQTMASQVAIAIENTRLLDQAQTALAEMEATQRRYVRRGWSEFERQLEQTEYEVARPGAAPVDEDLTEKIQRALVAREPQVVTPDDEAGPARSVLVAPSLLRGQSIGGLMVQDDSGEREWTDDEIALMEVVAERMAIIAENMRLLDETQRRAARERLTSEISEHVRGAATDIDDVLQTTLRELSGALKASGTIVIGAGHRQEEAHRDE